MKKQRASGIGGQAVLEGIMMRSGDRYAIAVRKSSGEIVVKEEDYKPVIPLAGIENIPVLRGVNAFIDSLVLGMHCIFYSASVAEEEEEEIPEDAAARERYEQKKKKEDSLFMTLTVILSVLLTVGLFILLPYFLAGLLRRVGAAEFTVSLTEAIVRIAIFLAYMLLISRMKDIQTVFSYHGAEHKSINCIEGGDPLTVENVLRSSRQHRRCGTSFLLFVIILSVIFFMLLGLLGITSPLWRVVLRVLLFPHIAGLSYEIIRLAGRSSNPVVAALSAPGLAMQRLVTREPDAAQAEVASAAVEAVVDWREYLEKIREENAQ